MTVVVADTSPLNYLMLVGQIEILHALYRRVVVPPEVSPNWPIVGPRSRFWIGLSHGPNGWRYSRFERTRPTPPYSRSTPESAQRFFWRKRNPMFCCSSTTPRGARKPPVVTFPTLER